ncbi:serine hydrolase domain-containing protein [Oenococcus sicerae]|uniref:Class A beta-lactamase-related serine hydrolase n=1 Tax=Oenococcus sicerae TaxID=2203724 RepID=A0AAJ1RAI5_9LACO|nr:serine hydrolase domain-containing protein [Oenococcus sicerae]MDN6900520.1 class A beta-lactamase-related serine hydrolase [Oenococcus sicerae]
MKHFFAKSGLFLFALFLGLAIYLFQADSQHDLASTKSGQPIKDYHYIKPDLFSIDRKSNFSATRIKKSSPLATKIDAEIKTSNFSGSILLVSHNKILINKGYSYADRASAKLNTPKSLYGLASIQKSLTALLIMKQIQAGKLTLQTKLSRFYPNLPNADSTTVQNLLTMTSGLSAGSGPTDLMSDSQYIDWYIQHTVQKFPVGRFHYDATNFKILAGILESITKKSYRDNLDAVFGRKFDFVNGTGFSASPDRTFSYKSFVTQKAANNGDAYLAREVATGNLFTTTGNLYLYFHELFSGKLIPPAMISQMFAKVNGFPYASGAYNEPKFYKAHGYILGYEPTVFISKDNQTTVIMLANTASKPAWQDLAEKIFWQLMTN